MSYSFGAGANGTKAGVEGKVELGSKVLRRCEVISNANFFSHTQ